MQPTDGREWNGWYVWMVPASPVRPNLDHGTASGGTAETVTPPAHVEFERISDPSHVVRVPYVDAPRMIESFTDEELAAMLNEADGEVGEG